MKVAIVYDRVNKWGGAERVLLALHKIFPKASLFTSVYDSKGSFWSDNFEVKPSFLQAVPSAKKYHELFATFMPVVFESFSFDDYDVVISVTSEAAKGIFTKPKTFHICICLTPTRYLWSGYGDYFKNPILRIIAKPVVSYLRNWDRIAAHRPDRYIAISNEVKKRIKKHYGIEQSVVIYPPSDMILNSKFSKAKPSNNKAHKKKQSYFLVVSRLVGYKRIDIVIDAFNKLPYSLKIIGVGSESKKLKRKAGKNIEFLNYLTDRELSYYYTNASALIFPGVEDFGIVMVEAQSFGLPVIAFREGGATEIVLEGRTGEFFNEQSTDSLIQVLKKFDKSRYNSKDCKKNAERFSYKKFEKKFKEFFDKEIKEYFKI